MRSRELLSFEEGAAVIRNRLTLDLENPYERIIDATIRSNRSGSRQFAFVDGLIGFGEGLREVLLSWGVSDSAIFTNDTPVEGHFVRRKYWDFAVRNPVGWELALIELLRVSPGAAGGDAKLASLCHKLLGVLQDLRSTGRRPFTGLAFVYDDPEGKSTPRAWRRRREILERFDRACRLSGLLDATVSLEVARGVCFDPSPALRLAPFLATLHRRLSSLDLAAWHTARSLADCRMTPAAK